MATPAPYWPKHRGEREREIDEQGNLRPTRGGKHRKPIPVVLPEAFRFLQSEPNRLTR